METLNIRSDSSDWRAAILSNLAPTTFLIGSYLFSSVESALQGIKFSDEEHRKKIFLMDGILALREGRKITNKIKENEKYFVFWDGEVIEYNSIKHRLLLAMFIGEKIRQNKNVQEALLSTTGTFIFHEVGKESPNTSLPEKFFIEVLLSQRKLLKRLSL